jgi:hypothetical protein
MHWCRCEPEFLVLDPDTLHNCVPHHCIHARSEACHVMLWTKKLQWHQQQKASRSCRTLGPSDPIDIFMSQKGMSVNTSWLGLQALLRSGSFCPGSRPEEFLHLLQAQPCEDPSTNALITILTHLQPGLDALQIKRPYKKIYACNPHPA